MRPAALTAFVLLAACSGEAADADAPPAAPAARSGATASQAPPGAPRLALPIDCRIGDTCEIQNYLDRDPGPGVQDYRCSTRTYEGHGGVDIRLPDMAAQRRGVAVLAAASGRVSRLRDGVADVSVRAAGPASVAGAECGNGVVIDHGNGWETQYCHLAKGSVRVKVGDAVAAGQPIAQVGLSGNTEYPHLHLTVRRGTVTIDPFRPAEGGACALDAAPAAGLWTPEAATALEYKAGAVLNAGFAAGPVTNEQIEAGDLPPTGSDPVVLTAYVRAISLESGDVLRLRLLSADGAVLADSRLPPLDRAKAQYMMFVGKRRPPDGWPSGAAQAEFTIERRGELVLTHNLKAKAGG